MNEFIATLPFDVYELQLFHLVAILGSFTKAGQRVGLTQSAITRQIKGMEDSLGVALFERTTRQVSLTPAGKFLFERTQQVLRDVTDSIQQLQRNFELLPKILRVGISRTIGLAYFPGFLVSFRKKFPSVQLQVTHQSSRDILQGLDSKDLDIGLVCPPPRLPGNLIATHAFEDGFIVIAPPDLELPLQLAKMTPAKLIEFLSQEPWLLIDRECNTGKMLQEWMHRQGMRIQPAMEMDNFDVIVNLVGMGTGVSLVPHRALPLYPSRGSLKRIRLRPVFSRKLVVLTRKNQNQPELITQFVQNILF